MTATNEPSKPRSRAQVWLLVGIFFVPLVIAFALYYGTDGWRPAGSTNYGELVQPPRPLPEVTLTTATGEQVPFSSLQGKWNLLYVGNGQCDERCREALTLMRQTRLALNDDLTRVQRFFLVTADCCDQEYLEEQHPGLTVVLLNVNGGAEWRAVLQEATPEPLADAGRIYIVDPLGNLMMSYSRDVEPKGLLEDLEKLLKLSHIG